MSEEEKQSAEKIKSILTKYFDKVEYEEIEDFESQRSMIEFNVWGDANSVSLSRMELAQSISPDCLSKSFLNYCVL